MPNSSFSRNSDAEVRAFLARALPDARLTNAANISQYQPLLLMRTNHVMAAFAFANGDMHKSYEALYGGFKKYYADQKDELDALDLAFVFCIQPEVEKLDDFCSSVETDVYFCRKFVIPLTAPLSTSLARLPFLPLMPVHGQSLRPPSAQTFLQQCGVPATLAKYLVVQQTRSPEGIVEDCTMGTFGDLRPVTPASTAPVVQPDRSTKSVRLESLEIQNFRAYRKPQTFALGAAVTILYGPNGFGKTSFFDAVDFAITGGIGRVESHPGRQSDFAKTALHLDSGTEDGRVSLRFRSNGALRTITRSVNDRKQALLDGRPTDRKTILSELTGGDSPATDRVENFVSLFRASHLFSQEHQELTKDFQDDCRLSADIVSRMLAFEDYANAVNKSTKVRNVVHAVISSANQEIKVLSVLINAENMELNRLGQTAKAHINIGVLDKEIDRLRGRLVAAGIVVTNEKFDAAIVRGWRAALESRYAQSRATSERLTVLSKEVAGLPQTRLDLASAQHQLAQKEQALKTAEEKRIAAELMVQHAEQRLAEMTTKRVEAEVRADLYQWIRNAQPSYARLVAQQLELGTELERATEAMTQLLAAEDKAVGELHARQAAATHIAEDLKARLGELTAAQALHDAIPVWQANQTRLAKVLQSEQEQLKTLESIRTAERELAPQLATVTAEEARLRRQIAEADKNQSELRALVSQLQGHVITAICPLCGEDHGSKVRLLQRIQKHVVADAASGARADLTGVRERAKQFAERVAANKQKLQAADEQLVALKIDRARLETEIANFAIAASKLAIATGTASSTAGGLVQVLLNRLQHEVAELNKQGQAADAAILAARTTVANSKNAIAARKQEVNEKKAGVARTQAETNRLRADPRLTQVALDVVPSQLVEFEQLNLKRLEEFKAEAAKAGLEANQKKSEISVFRQEATSLKAQIATLRAKIGQCQKTLAQVTVRLEESELPVDSNEESLLVLISEQSRSQAQFLALRDETSSLEMAMDAATTAAALTTLQETVRNREKAVARATTTRDRHLPWLKYFEEVSRLVDSQQNEAIANFTREIGPRTSVIQRRLRSVYGFDDIEITGRESTISVRVRRHGVELRPTDYFSQSQQQTLLLGLFLTASSSQTWSSFSPVLLDDPVTHFDDLNTYAFLDLLDGLCESEVEKRQFIISTCDEKLLQLARQKFRRLGEGAKFYRFTAIGADGPTIKDVT